MLSRLATTLVLVSAASVASGPLRSGAYGPAFVAPSLLPRISVSPAADPSCRDPRFAAPRLAVQRGARSNGALMMANGFEKMFKDFTGGLQQTLKQGGADLDSDRLCRGPTSFQRPIFATHLFPPR